MRRPFRRRAGETALAARQERPDNERCRWMCSRPRALPLPASWSATIAMFCGVSTDSRTIAPGELFIALRGRHFGNHAYLAAARARGAVAAIVAAAGLGGSASPSAIFRSSR